MQLTDDDIEKLIQDYKTNKRETKYSLKELLSNGLKYFHGMEHLKKNEVVPCMNVFSIYNGHQCNTVDTLKNHLVEMRPHKLSINTLSFCFTGYNLAIITADGQLEAYFKTNSLFKKHIPRGVGILATCDKIFISTVDGNVVTMDPISQTESTHNYHTDVITSMSYEDGLLTSSLDGSIYHKGRKKINTTGIMNVKMIKEDKYMCCGGEEVVLYDSGEVKTYDAGSKVRSITYNKVGVCTTAAGEMGILYKDDSFESDDLGISLHTRKITHQVVGYGLKDILCYDINAKKEDFRIPRKTLNLDTHMNAIAYSDGATAKIIDKRDPHKEGIEAHLNETIRDLKFSKSGDVIIICTDDSTYLNDIRYL